MKLFGKNGKMNIVDIVLLVALAAVIAFVAFYFIAERNTDGLGGGDAPAEPDLRFVVLCEDLPAELGEGLLAEISDDAVEVTGNMVNKNRLFNDSMLVDAFVVATDLSTNEDGTVNVRITVEAATELETGVYKLGTQEIRIGSYFNVKTLTAEQKGTVVSMEKLHD